MKLAVLGIGQDEGVPGFGGTAKLDSTTGQPIEAYAACLAFYDDERQFIVETTPDFRDQYRLLQTIRAQGSPKAAAAARRTPRFDGIFLTHAHIGHYSGLQFLGKESVDSKSVPVHCLPRMAQFLAQNGPWSQLVERRNIELRVMTANEPVELAHDLTARAILVPHRGEYSETAAFMFECGAKTVLFLPDIDRWEQLDEWMGERAIERLVEGSDVAFLDATFYSGDELGGRDMSEIPHPCLADSVSRLRQSLTPQHRKKVHFIHLNASNPALDLGSAQRRAVVEAGFQFATQGQVFDFNSK